MNDDQMPLKVDFDEYAEKYTSMLQEQLSYFSEDRSYFSRYKAKILGSLIEVKPLRVLDFGAGVGLMVPHLQSEFPNAKIFVTDISSKSLEMLSERFSDIAVVPDAFLEDHRFDVILISTVLHHIDPGSRHAVMQRLGKLLTPGGSICIFEHNPFNPLTRRLVATCPFDVDAVLLSMLESSRLMTSSAGLSVSSRGYTLFVPPRLVRMTWVEKYLKWLPLGGQYFVCGRNDCK